VLAKLREAIRLLAVEQVGVVAHLSELDQDVLVVRDRVALLDALLLEQVTVNTLLLLGNADIDMNLYFGLK
jgi:hypothetical protein